MKVKINVKEEHIITGICRDVRECAISRAICDIFPDAMTRSSYLCINNIRIDLPSNSQT